MLRPVSNPPNPFLSTQRELLEEPPAAALVVYEEQAASILARNDSPDIAFEYSVNPYRGCQHGCAYCYARPTHEYLGLGAGSDFDTQITVKVNAPQLLRKALARRSWQRQVIAFSGVTDCYQPLEACYRLTQQCLQVCWEFANPVGIVTKSFLVVRDIDLLAALQRRGGARVYMSIAFADERISRLIDQGAPTPNRRFEAMRRLHDAGIPVGLMLAPLIPGLNDRDIPELLQRAADAGARSAAYLPLRLPGSARDVFLQRVRERLPERATRIEQRIRDMRGGALNRSGFGERMRGEGAYWASIQRLFATSAARVGLDGAARTAIPSSPQRTPGASTAGSAQWESQRAGGSAARGVQLPLFPG